MMCERSVNGCQYCPYNVVNAQRTLSHVRPAETCRFSLTYRGSSYATKSKWRTPSYASSVSATIASDIHRARPLKIEVAAAGMGDANAAAGRCARPRARLALMRRGGCDACGMVDHLGVSSPHDDVPVRRPSGSRPVGLGHFQCPGRGTLAWATNPTGSNIGRGRPGRDDPRLSG